MQLVTVFTEPSRLFDELKLKPNFALPLLLMLVGMTLTWWCYYQRVDAGWLLEQLAGAGDSPAKQQAVREHLRIGMIKWPTLIGGPIMLLAMYLISALYYKLAGKVCGTERTFLAWLSFTAWSAMPVLLSLLVALIQTLIMSPQSMPTDISLTHIDPLLVSLPLRHPWHGFLTAVDLLQLWAITVAAIGWRSWTGSGWKQAITVALLPTIVIYGGWALFIIAKH